MPMGQRYTLLLIAVAFYYLQAFMPIMSVDVPDGAVKVSAISALSWLSGYSYHPYHYLTIGLMPFIFSGLFMQLMQWQLKPLHDRFAGDPISSEKTKRVLTYLFAAGAGAFQVSTMESDWFSYHPLVTWAEFILSVYFLETLFDLIKPLKVVGSPITLFLGLNVVGAIAGQLVGLEWGNLNDIELMTFVSAVVIGVLFIILAIRVERWRSMLAFAKAVNTNASGVAHLVPVKVMRVGMMPVIYAGFVFYPAMMILSGWNGATTGQVMLSSWYYPPVLIGMVYLLTKALLSLHTPTENILHFARQEGVYMVGGDAEHNALIEKLKNTVKRHALLATGWFSLVLFTEAVWQVIAPESLTKLGFVGGISIVILVSASRDIVKHYLKLKEEVRYV